MRYLLITFLLLSFTTLFANEIIEYNFNYPLITESEAYNELNYDNCINLGEEGDPAMPQYAASILLQEGETAIAIEILNITYYNETSLLRLKPEGKTVPLCESGNEDFKLWESEVYSQKSNYPADKFSEPYTGFLCGHPITSFTLCPVEYKPFSGETRFIESIELKIVTSSNSEAQTAAEFLRHNSAIETRLLKLVDNASAIDNYIETKTSRPDVYDILLITSAALEPYFADYIQYKQTCGYYVATLTVEDIFAQYTGADSQIKIRNAIIDYYQNNNISYVILGGDSDPQNAPQYVIPHRGFYVDYYFYIDDDIPADMYYACLDGNWNDDYDNMWGEEDEADLYAEVSVGRICVDDAEEIVNQTHKLMMYGSSPVVNSTEEFLMIGESLGNDTYGGQYMNDIVTGGDINGYTTEGFPDNIIVNTLYAIDYNWSSDDLYNSLNAGVNMVHHLGHGSTVHCFNIQVTNLTPENLTNNGITSGYYTAYSQACYSGAFDNRHNFPGAYYDIDCFCEEITTISTGACSFIGNSRYGWYVEGSTNGRSQHFHRQYVDAIFGENITLIGDANNDSKEDNTAFINSHIAIRWCCYELNLLGDPTMDIWTAMPQDMEVTIPASIQIGSDQINVCTNVSGAMIAILRDQELLGRGLTHTNGNHNLHLEDVIPNLQTLDVVITAHNYKRWEGVIPVVSDLPYIVYENYSLTEIAGNGNGQADYNETLSLDLNLHNIGALPANDLVLNVSTLDEYVTFIDASTEVDVIGAETTIQVANAVSFILADNVPDQHIIEFSLIINAEEGLEWNYIFTLIVNAPVLSFGGFIIDDSATGNNNGFLDPAEDVVVNFNIMNIGHCLSPSGELQLSSNNAGIDIDEQSIELEEIAPEESALGSFHLYVSNDIGIGTRIKFTLNCVCDEYSLTHNFISQVGLIIETFESGDFSSNDWEFAGNADWTIDEQAYGGIYCARSGTITNNQTSILHFELSAIYDAEISFFKKVSSQEEYDKLQFCLDGAILGEWSGESDWSQETFYIRYGHHTLDWIYTKNSSYSSGNDCAWIDNIVFPPIGEPTAPSLSIDPPLISLNCYPGSVIESELQLSNTGGGTILYEIHTDADTTRNLGQSDVENSTSYFEKGIATTWVFTVRNRSWGSEYIRQVDMQFPIGVTVTSAQDFIVEPNRIMFWDEVTGDGVLTSWSGTMPNGWGVLQLFESVSAEVDVEISADVSDELEIGYMIYGDGGGCAPHTVSDTILVTVQFPWIGLSQHTGSLNGNESDQVTITFDATDLEIGLYQCEMVISSSDIAADVIIPVSLNVTANATLQNELPAVTLLNNCYPNPFNPETNISYKLAQASPVILEIYNIRGQLVKTLVTETQDAGQHWATWNGVDKSSNSVASGIYFYRLQANGCNQTQKMILLK